VLLPLAMMRPLANKRTQIKIATAVRTKTKRSILRKIGVFVHG
jgi:hypothetical protein